MRLGQYGRPRADNAGNSEDRMAEMKAQANGPDTEVVGIFAMRETFTAAVKELLASGFERADLSVLNSHDSLAAAEGPEKAWRLSLSGLVGEISFLPPITAAGLILLASGPVGAAVAGVIAAGLGGMALYDLLTEVQATPHAHEFARALEKGAVLLWVRTRDAAQQATASDVLARHGAANIHVHSRASQTAS